MYVLPQFKQMVQIVNIMLCIFYHTHTHPSKQMCYVQCEMNIKVQSPHNYLPRITEVDGLLNIPNIRLV